MKFEDIITYPVAEDTIPSKLASSVLQVLESGRNLRLSAIGAAANYAVIKALFKMNEFLSRSGSTDVILIVPEWTKVISDNKENPSKNGEELTAVYHYLKRIKNESN